MRAVFAVLSGALFGAGLHVSGMTNTARVRGFLDFAGAWDPTLAFVMGGAMLPMFVAWRFARRGTPVAGPAFPPPPSSEISRPLIAGSVLFGVGWGLVGLCPGPALASLSYGGWPGLVFLAAMLAGMGATPPLRRALDRRAAGT
ncbi:DUF6691 family protein [uncultured Tateyamaria sp.]|uniref:DUF6691 family protein n=1 Tax=Tateyamaria sp. 1078 TaxID=3417464 RepID=UPI0026373A4F|nr:DUF6691 family protein [uncultured Tateyamaria sp.]